MCRTAVNRRNVTRVVKEGDVTGKTLQACAVNIVARLGAHPSCVRRALEVLEDLQDEGKIILDDAVLKHATVEEQKAILEGKKRRDMARRGARERAIAHRMKGIRGMTFDDDVAEGPHVLSRGWVGFNPRRPHGLVLRTQPIPPAGGWAEDLRELKALMEDQFNDWMSQAEPVEGCCGSVDDLVDAGLDAEDVFVDPDADFEENRFALVR